MKKCGIVFVLAMLLFVLVACASNGGTQTAQTTSSAHAPTSETAPTPMLEPKADHPLVGRWRSDDHTLEFRPDGSGFSENRVDFWLNRTGAHRESNRADRTYSFTWSTEDGRLIMDLLDSAEIISHIVTARGSLGFNLSQERHGADVSIQGIFRPVGDTDNLYGVRTRRWNYYRGEFAGFSGDAIELFNDGRGKHEHRVTRSYVREAGQPIYRARAIAVNWTDAATFFNWSVDGNMFRFYFPIDEPRTVYDYSLDGSTLTIFGKGEFQRLGSN